MRVCPITRELCEESVSVKDEQTTVRVLTCQKAGKDFTELQACPLGKKKRERKERGDAV